MKKLNNTGFGGAFARAAALCALAAALLPAALPAQEYTGPHEVKWIRVGDLRQWYTNAGMEIEYGLISRAAAQNTQQADEMMWEALYYRTDTQCSRSLWIGATDFADPKTGLTYPFKVCQAGPRYLNTLTNFVPGEFKLYGRFNHPIVTVDGADGTDNTLDDIVDEIDPDLPADRVLVNVTETNIGVRCERTIYAYSQQNHDDYHIYDFVFTNVGLKDGSGAPVNQTLNGVYFAFTNRYAPGHQGYIGGWHSTGNVSWGRNTVLHTIGQDPTDPLFEMRASYAWYGPHSQASMGYEADWGEPNYGGPGVLGAPGFCGVATLHADKSATDKSDDLEQPKSTPWWDTDDNIMNWIDSYNINQMTLQYAAMSAGHPDQTHAEAVGDGNFADLFGPGIGGSAQILSYGPYTLEPGQSVHIVMAEGVNGLTRRKSLEVGTNWFNNAAPFTMPDGSTSSDRHAYKRAWVWTAEDSIKETLRRAIRAYNNNLVIPQPPPPPETFTVSSGGDRIVLEWANNAESWPYFNGYEIYRASARPDTLYDLLFSCDKNNVVNRFDDITAKRGFNYYYYIVSKDDGSQNDIKPGTPLVSSKYYTVTNQPAYLRRPSVLTTMDSIRVVPNPFHLGGRSIQFDQPDRIAFFGLPPQCTIKIYTERGDLIKTLNHTNNSGDELWESVTSSRQVVVSGLYIAVFETPDGEKTFRKFVIIR
ncbi:MAG: hypothetical protein QUS35_06430 [bacterium]|nr:hypothetical protein [bacterium]